MGGWDVDGGGYSERLSTSILHCWFVLALCVRSLSLAGRRVRFDLDYTAPYPRLALIRMPQPRARRRRPRAGMSHLTQLLLAHTHDAPVSHHLSSSPCALRRCHASSSSSRRITQRSPPSLDSSCARQRHASPRGRTSRRRCGSLRATDRTTRHSVPTSFRCVCASYYCPLYPPAHAAHVMCDLTLSLSLSAR